jgi:hypothetical protein
MQTDLRVSLWCLKQVVVVCLVAVRTDILRLRSISVLFFHLCFIVSSLCDTIKEIRNNDQRKYRRPEEGLHLHLPASKTVLRTVKQRLITMATCLQTRACSTLPYLEISKQLVSSEVFPTAIMKMKFFWNVALCSLVEVYRRFRGTCCLHHQGDDSQDHWVLKSQAAAVRRPRCVTHKHCRT